MQSSGDCPFKKHLVHLRVFDFPQQLLSLPFHQELALISLQRANVLGGLFQDDLFLIVHQLRHKVPEDQEAGAHTVVALVLHHVVVVATLSVFQV